MYDDGKIGVVQLATCLAQGLLRQVLNVSGVSEL